MDKVKLKKARNRIDKIDKSIFNLIKTNALLAKTIEDQQREIEMLNFRVAGWLDWEKHKKKHTNKKYLRKEH